MEIIKKLENTRFNAFTLAEVLITLGIIGIVAAMTMPSLIEGYKEKQAVTQLKKAYSAIQQAFIFATAENDTPDNWGMGDMYDPETHIIIANHFKKHMKVVNDCVGKDASYVQKNCIDQATYMQDKNAASFVSNEGVSYIFRNWIAGCSSAHGEVTNVCGSIVVDINGLKIPNQFGYDIFFFYVTKNRILPMGVKGARVPFNRGCDRNNANPVEGFSNKFIACAAWVIYNENMDYKRCDGLDWDGKIKCK